MKLRNKKTGEIGYLIVGRGSDYYLICNDEWISRGKYNSLNEVNDDWEDYEEPKEYYYIDIDGIVEVNSWDTEDDIVKGMRTIGNYFETREEAEKAVEKLKAWKRLKDKGFKIIGVRGIGKVIDFDIPEPYNHIGFDEYNANEDEKEFYDDLLLIFGGEE